MAYMFGLWNQCQIKQFLFQRGILIDCLDVEKSQDSSRQCATQNSCDRGMLRYRLSYPGAEKWKYCTCLYISCYFIDSLVSMVTIWESMSNSPFNYYYSLMFPRLTNIYVI